MTLLVKNSVSKYLGCILPCHIYFITVRDQILRVWCPSNHDPRPTFWHTLCAPIAARIDDLLLTTDSTVRVTDEIYE